MRSIRRSGSMDAFMGNRKDRQHGQTARRDLVTRITLMGEARVTPLKKEKPASQPAFLVDRNFLVDPGGTLTPPAATPAVPLPERSARSQFASRARRESACRA